MPFHRMSTRRRVVVVVGALVVACALVMLVAFVTSLTRVSQTEHLVPGGSGTTYLIVGVDGREQIRPSVRSQYRLGRAPGARADTIMMLHTQPGSDPILVSLPRDSWVSLPDSGGERINNTYQQGGPQLLAQTVEYNTEVRIDHYIQIGLTGVPRLVDAVGEIEMCPAQDYNDKNSGLDVSAGCQVMGGGTALAYVRMRMQDPSGDVGRTARQQEYVGALLDRILSPNLLVNPVALTQLVRAAGESLTVDGG